MNDPVSLFFQIAHRFPAIAAVVDAEKTYTYHNLLQRALGIAETIKNNGYTSVAIFMPAGFDAYAVMWGALIAGAHYCPLNIHANDKKIQTILSIYNPDVVVCTDAEHMPDTKKPYIVCKDLSLTRSSTCEREYTDALLHQCAYVIFTSGSTGNPKGVQISRRALASYLAWVGAAFPMSPGLRWSQHPNMGFDLSVLDIFGALCHGATLYPLQSSFHRLFPGRFIRDKRIEVWNSTPSVLDLMSESNDITADNFHSVKMVSCCGEPLKQHTLNTLFTAHPGLTVQNTYGPTEATVSCTALIIDEEKIDEFCLNGRVALGSPIPGMGLLLEPLSGKTALSELIIYGEQVSFGYLKREDLNAEKFFDRVIQGRRERCYRTGDIVIRHNGQLYFHSRVDDIKKVKGHLVDLQHIERIVNRCVETDCCVIANEKQIALFYVADDALDRQWLRSRLMDELDEHELPSLLFKLAYFPYSQNDKVDRTALEEMMSQHA